MNALEGRNSITVLLWIGVFGFISTAVAQEIAAQRVARDAAAAGLGGKDDQVATLTQPLQVYGVGPVDTVAYSPDGRHILLGAKRHALMYSTVTFERERVFTGHTDLLTSVAFSPDGTQVLTSSEDGTTLLWDASTGAVLHTFTQAVPVYSVAFSPDGTKVLTGGGGSYDADCTAKVWEVSTDALVQTIACHTARIRSVAFSPDGTKVLTGAGSCDGSTFHDCTATLSDASTGALLQTFVGHAAIVNSVAFSPDGMKVLTGAGSLGRTVADPCIDCTARLWEAATGAVLQTFTGFTMPVYCVAFSLDGTRVLTGANSAKLWDVSTRAIIDSFPVYPGYWVKSAAFSPDGTKVLVGSFAWARLWDVTAGTVLQTFGELERFKVNCSRTRQTN